MDGMLGWEHGVVLPMRVDASGLRGPSRRQARGPEWRRTSHGRYVGAEVELTPAQRIAEVGVLLPTYGAITGWAAVAWCGGWWFSGRRGDGVSLSPVPVAQSRRSIRPREGILLCEERWSACDMQVVDGLRITSMPRSVAFEMRYAPYHAAAVAALDMAAFHDVVSIEEVAAWVWSHPSYTGIEQARLGLLGADENTWSPAEFSLREAWIDAGCPRPLTNRPIFDLNGRHLGTPDVIDPRTGVLGQYDGEEFHRGPQRARDLRQDHDFRSHGLEVVRMVAEDRHLRSPFFLRLRAAYAAAEARPAADRRWMLELPDWWVPTFTVAQRRALSPRDRELWLRHRLPGPGADEARAG